MTRRGLRYELPLKRPLRLGDQQVTTRCGWLVQRGDAVGDACPLPAFSIDSVADVDGAILRGQTTTASLSWALHALDLNEHAEVATAGLVTEADDVEAGDHACVKMKVGRRPLAEELRALASLRSTGVRIRLDGNRALTPEATARLADAAGDALKYVEEPVAPEHLAACMQRAPIALDETLLDAPVAEVPRGAAAFVIKPTLLGAEHTLALTALAARRGTPVVVSSCYESAVGRAGLVRFAAATAPDTVHGLGTGPAFASDFEGWVRTDGARLTTCAGALPEEGAWVTF